MNQIKSGVERFLIEHKVKPADIYIIRAKVEEVADQEGMFSDGELEWIMGQELAQAYRKACAENPSLMPK